MAFLDHKQLKIIRGVYIVPGDANSVEAPLKTLNLLSKDTGIALAPDGWSPKIPSLKSGGVWADSPIADGRTLISGVNSNVTEVMRIIITGATFQDAVAQLSGLTQMIEDARDFWQDNAQIDPVYLAWWASCGAGLQYALIYNMDFDGAFSDSQTPTIEGTLTIERECFWRAIPPGANPKQWRYEFYHEPWTNTEARIGDDTSAPTDLVVTSTLQNKSEFSSSTRTALLSTNCITISASLVPGDAPALMFFYSPLFTGRQNVLMGKKTRKVSAITLATGAVIAQNGTLNGNAGLLGTNASIAADTGGVADAGTGTLQRIEVSFATATNALRWTAQFDINRFIGRWMVFLRCRQQGGTLGDITMYFRYGSQILADTDGVKLNVVNPPVIAGAGNTTVWGLTYMGVITIPLVASKAAITRGGLAGGAREASGLNNDASGSSVNLGLFALRSAGAAPLYFADVVLIPVDEGSVALDPADSAISTAMWYDETGYFTHGMQEPFATNAVTPYGNAKLVKISGSGIQLSPNVENRLYFVIYDTSKQSACTDTTTFNLNIVPRWRGIRGV